MSAFKIPRSPDELVDLSADHYSASGDAWDCHELDSGEEEATVSEIEFEKGEPPTYVKEVGVSEDARESNLVAHARRELQILGEDERTIVGYLKVIQAFADMGHSGGSASFAIPVITKLLSYQNLKPLTNNPSEWMYVGDFPMPMWQNVRNSECFSEDGGKTYYCLSEIVNYGTKQERPIHTSEEML